MHTQNKVETIRKQLVEKILTCLEGETPKEYFIELAKNLNNTPEINADTSLLQSFTVLEFIAHQMKNGNEDILTPQFMQESCTYMLSKLVPNT